MSVTGPYRPATGILLILHQVVDGFSSDTIHVTAGDGLTLCAAQAGVADLVHTLGVLRDITAGRWASRITFTLTSAAVNVDRAGVDAQVLLRLVKSEHSEEQCLPPF